MIVGKNPSIFKLYFAENYFEKNDILSTDKNVQMKVLETPHKTKFKRFLQFITFGLYQAPICYKCKIIENNQK